MFTLSTPNSSVKSSSLDIVETSRHQYLTLLCSKCGFRYQVNMRCGDRTCSECRYSDYIRLLKSFQPFLLTKSRLRLITLTLRGRASVLPRARIIRLRKCFQLLLHQNYYRSRLTGGLYTIEAKKKPSGWNIHLHILAEGSFISQKRLSSDWLQITGDSFVVDIRESWSGFGGLKYILKYLSKAPEVSGCENEYNEAFAGSRFVSAFGSWYGKVSLLRADDFVCPLCGSVAWCLDSFNSFKKANDRASP